MSNIVGLSAYYHDSACCLLQDGTLVAAAQEERFTRKKHDRDLPKNAFRYCLAQGRITVKDLDCIAYFEDPAKKLARQLWMDAAGVRQATLKQVWSNSKKPKSEIVESLGYDGRIEIFDHHHSHAASSYYYSGFEDAAILTVDGVGEWATTTYGRGFGKDVEIFEEVNFPDSLGLFYSTITNYLGFEVNDGEYKVMGLAPYGRPIYRDKLWGLLKSGDEGKYRLALEYFDFVSTKAMFSEALSEYLGHEPRKPGSEILDFHKDIARSLQVVLEEILLEKVAYLYDKVGSKNLCMAGGVALNCVANGRIIRESKFNNLFVQPAAGDAGTSLGAAALAYVKDTNMRPPGPAMITANLGPSYSATEVRQTLAAICQPADYRRREEEMLEATVDRLVAGKVVGWFQGRMEFGPRALGARSILADPRHAGMRDLINSRVKKREEFRPFAPAVLLEKAREHFDLQHPSPFMLETCQVISRIDLPAITHVDGSARVQTVDRRVNPRFARLLECFERRTGCPILLNTSFNMRDEPIVCTPAEALICFLRSNMETLVIEDFIVDREALASSWGDIFSRLFQPQATNISNLVYTFV